MKEYRQKATHEFEHPIALSLSNNDNLSFVPMDNIQTSDLNYEILTQNISFKDQVLEVQKFLGYAIKEVIVIHQRQRDKMEQPTSQIKHQLQLLERMRISHADVMSVSYHDYHDKYYPPHLEMMNNGKLSLVAPMFIDFGMKLLAKIRELINESNVWKKGRYALSEAYSLLVNDEILLASYIHSYNDSQDNIEFYSMVYKKYIVTKTLHSQSSVVTKHFKAFNTGRYANKTSNEALRTTFRVQDKGKCERAHKRLRSMIDNKLM